MVACAPLENADSDLLTLFGPNTIITTDANGRTSLDYAQAANHDKNTDWNAVGSSYSENTTANGRGMVNLCD